MKGWRTILLNLAVGLLLVTDYLVTSNALLSRVVTDAKDAAFLILGVNILNILLRAITTTRVGSKE